jgi:hypothetical protein
MNQVYKINKEELGRRYLLYLRDMSRKVIFGSAKSSAGDYTRILVLNSRKKDDSKFSRMTEWTLSDLRLKGKDGAKLAEKQSNIGNGIFCAAGVIAGVISPKATQRGRTSVIAAPLVYGQIQFEEDGESEITEWLLNYDLATELLSVLDDEKSEGSLNLEISGIRPAEVIRGLEERLEILEADDLEEVHKISRDYHHFLSSILNIEFGDCPSPIVAVKIAMGLNDAKEDGVNIVDGDWIFTAPVPSGLNTYTALQDIAKKLGGMVETSMNTLFRVINSVFTGEEFQSVQLGMDISQIFDQLKEIPYQLSIEQKKAVVNALTNDVSYIQGPPGTGKSFTISALSLVASRLGQRVLVTSQKIPAVEIVYSKITNVVGDDSCLFLSDDSDRKLQTKLSIARILERTRTQEYDADQKNLLASVNTTLQRLERSKEQLGEIYKLLNEHYRNNEAYLDALERVTKIYPDAQFDFGSIHMHTSEDVNTTLKSMLKTCRSIRDQARSSSSQVKFSDALKLKVSVLALMKRMGASIDDYRKYREDYLEEIITLAEDKGAAWRVNERIDSEQIRYLRNSQIVALQRLYEWDANNDNLLARKLSSENNTRVSALLMLNGYSESLRAFTARLRWKTKSRVDSANKKIDFTKLFEVFPIVLGEIKALHPYLPFQSDIFDLVIIDEASQVNLAEIIPILYRAKRICIVGDHKQLGIEAGGLIFLNKFFERLMWQRHFENIPGRVLTVDEAKQRSLLVTDSSILDLARNEANALLTEKNSNTLREHFRSLPMLAEFTSNEFYKENPKEEGLRVMTSTPGRQKLVAFKNIEVNGTRSGGSNKSNPDEVRKVVDLLGSILKRDETEDLCELWKVDELSEIPTIGVVSFISDQIVALEEACLQSFSIEDIRKIDLMIGTPEKFQGNERDVIIFTPSVDESCSMSVGFMEKATRFNVATSRAKFFTFFVHGKLPKNMERMQRMIKSMDSPISETASQVRLPRGWQSDPSTIRSQIEKELYEDLINYRFERSSAALHVFNKVKTCGLVADFVLYSERDDRAFIIEIDGKNSVVLLNEDNDRQTERYLTFRRAGWDVYYYDYLKRYKSDRTVAFGELKQHADKFFALS